LLSLNVLLVPFRAAQLGKKGIDKATVVPLVSLYDVREGQYVGKVAFFPKAGMVFVLPRLASLQSPSARHAGALPFDLRPLCAL
jgi:hypothetical protein